MNREQIIANLILEREQLTKQIEICRERLKSVPPGKLKTVKRSQSYEYYLRKSPQDKTGQYIKKKDCTTLRTFTQKQYDIFYLNEASKRISLIDSFLTQYDINSFSNLLHQFTLQQQNLIKSFEIDNSTYLSQWIAQQYPQKPIQDNLAFHYSEKGERMRSKSEVIIADTLLFLNIPYHYEKPVKLKNGQIFHPDFTLPNVNLRRDVYYEHLGLIDTHDYFINSLKRLDLFADNNILLGNNLIVTYETSDKPLNKLQVIDTLKRYYVNSDPLPYRIILP